MKKLDYYQTEPKILREIFPNAVFGFELEGKSPLSEVMIKFEEKCFNENKISRSRHHYLEIDIEIQYSKSFPDQEDECSESYNCSCQEN